MKRIILVLMVCLTLPLNSIAMEKLTGVTTSYEPYYGDSMKDMGPVIKLTKMALKEVGYELDVKIKPWSRCIKEAKAGKFDILIGLWYSKEREKWMAFSNSIIDNEIGFYKRKGSSLTFNSYDALKKNNVRIGTVRNYVNPKEFDEAKLFVDPASDDLTNLRKLLRGRIDLVLIDRLIGKYMVQQNMSDRVDELVWIATLQKNPLRNGILKTTQKDWKKNLEMMNKGFEILKSKGVVAEVLAEYGL